MYTKEYLIFRPALVLQMNGRDSTSTLEGQRQEFRCEYRTMPKIAISGAVARLVNKAHNTNLHTFHITTTHRVHSIAKTFIDHRLIYVSYSNCK
jgi:hypothetical protein